MNMPVAAQGRNAAKRPLPEGWRWARLGDVCSINPRRPTIQRADETLTTFVPMEAVDAISGTVADARVRPYGEIKRGYTYFENGDVLFAKITPCMQNGKHFIASELLDGMGFGTTEFHVIRPSADITAEWIHYFIRQPVLLKEATNHFTGAVGQQRLPQEYLAGREVLLPPVSYQRRIVGLLDERMAAVERARRAAEDMIEQIEALKNAFLREIFALGKNLASGWRWVTLGEIVDVLDSKRKPITRQNRKPGPYPYYGATGILDSVDDYIFDEPLVLVGEDGAKWESGENTAYSIVGKTWVNNHAHVLRPDRTKVMDQFLVAFFIQTDITPYVTGLTVPKLTQAMLHTIPIPLPSMVEQRRIVALLDEQIATVERAKAAAQAQLDAINALPGTWQRLAFGGELC